MGDIADLTAKAYEITRMIPYGRVTSYGESHLLRLSAACPLTMEI